MKFRKMQWEETGDGFEAESLVGTFYLVENTHAYDLRFRHWNGHHEVDNLMATGPADELKALAQKQFEDLLSKWVSE